MFGVAGPPARSRFGRRFLRRTTMNSKMGNKDFYKGRGSRKEGTHTNKGAPEHRGRGPSPPRRHRRSRCAAGPRGGKAGP